MVIGGIGMASTMTPTTAAAMGSVQRDKAGVGSAVLNSARQVGGSLGIAITGAIVASGMSSALAAGDTRPGGVRRAGSTTGSSSRRLIALAGSLIGFATVRKQPHHPRDGPAGPSSSRR